MIQILFSVLLSLFYCVILSLFIESDINNFVKNLVGKNNTFEFIIFLIFGILNGSISGYIISRYKNFNFIASIILPLILTFYVLYLYLFLPVFLSVYDMIDWNMTMLCSISIVMLYQFLKDPDNF